MSAGSNTDEMHQMIRNEMASVLNEIAQAQNHRGLIGASPLDAFSADTAANVDRLSLLKDRVAVLEDALAKSETDRAAVYLKLEHANRQLQLVNEEKLAMMHEFHDANHGPVAEATALLHAAQEDNQRLRHQLAVLADQWDSEVPALRSFVREQELELKRLRKASKSSSRDARYDGVTLADLHYSNERLSAQLAKLQSPPPPPVFDEAKFKELEHAVVTLTSEMSALEAKIVRMRTSHDAEKKELLRTLENQQKEFDNERAECDRVVQIMAGKLEALMEENNILRGVTGAGGARRTPTKR